MHARTHATSYNQEVFVGSLLLGVGIRLPFCAPTLLPLVLVGVVGRMCLGEGEVFFDAAVDVNVEEARRGDVLTEVGRVELGVVGRIEVVLEELGVVERTIFFSELGVVERTTFFSELGVVGRG